MVFACLSTLVRYLRCNKIKNRKVSKGKKTNIARGKMNIWEYIFEEVVVQRCGIMIIVIITTGSQGTKTPVVGEFDVEA